MQDNLAGCWLWTYPEKLQRPPALLLCDTQRHQPPSAPLKVRYFPPANKVWKGSAVQYQLRGLVSHLNHRRMKKHLLRQHLRQKVSFSQQELFDLTVRLTSRWNLMMIALLGGLCCCVNIFQFLLFSATQKALCSVQFTSEFDLWRFLED